MTNIAPPNAKSTIRRNVLFPIEFDPPDEPRITFSDSLRMTGGLSVPQSAKLLHLMSANIMETPSVCAELDHPKSK